MEAAFFFFLFFFFFFFSFFSVSLLFTDIISQVLKKKNKKREKNPNLPPSPPSLPILGHLHLFTKPLHQSLTDIAGRLGPTVFVRFGSRLVVIVSSPDVADRRNPPSGLPASAVAVPTSAAAAAAADEVRRLLRGLHREAEAAAAEWSVGGAVKVELKSRLFAVAVNAVMTAIAGKKYYGEEEEEEARRFRGAVEELFGFRGGSIVGEMVPAMRWVEIVEVGERLRRFREYMDGFLQKLIDERRMIAGSAGGREEGEDGEKTMISVLRSLQMADPEAKDLILSFLTEGIATISNTAEWAMSLLLNSPEKMKKARSEIDDLVGQGRLLQESDLPHLPFLRCIVKETLRLYPPAPLLPSPELGLDGFSVPAGATLMVNAYAVHRSPARWEAAEKFVPERFENNRGDGFAWNEMLCRQPVSGEASAVVVGAMIQCFEWERVGKEDVDMREGVGMTTLKAVPLEAVCTPRPLMGQVLGRL
ncbi:Cytochrome P450 81D1 [Apostasia shenzhenica]|uniref:Cytochrome P450 81D1 n=1 Tax=Apostasia shenzhenica TaxID=1088818 RepID=A0A2I0AAE1_9ASPA|nr:Cytochrome P450 81D1 [Apostasia shenzhenica]